MEFKIKPFLHLRSWQDYPAGDGSGTIELRMAFDEVKQTGIAGAIMRTGSPVAKIERIPYSNSDEREEIICQRCARRVK